MALLRRPRPRLEWLGPREVQEAALRAPEKSGLVELVGSTGPSEELEAALAATIARHPDRLWGGRLALDLFPTMVEEFLREKGMPRAELEAALPAAGLVRQGRLALLLRPDPHFARGRARQRSLQEQVDAFAVKFAVAYTPKPREDGARRAGGPGGAPAAAVNRDRPVPVTVTRGGSTQRVTLYEGENLLDGVLERGVELDYSCKQGMCDTCTVTVLRGGENLSEPTEGERKVLGELLDQGKRLSCQVIVKGPVEIRQ